MSGDVFKNISNATIINRSLITRSFSKVKEQAGDETAQVLIKVAEAVEKSGSAEAGELFNQFNEELQKPEPRKSVLRNTWDGILKVLPAVTTIAGAAGAIAKLFN